ncbi:uncharacterized protein [Coffea arabica]|uniref:Uncharacterized protein isoform X2 n=1 Tax=Coffea arabica TaxID=13443 RepID=A0A6P6SHC1_COFAR|nr:ankyrin repeat-containing protein ITN1-like isoform X1 [Coffea arabica]
MERLEMEKRLYGAAFEGNENTLHELLQEDKLVLDRVSLACFNYNNPLHIAINRGHEKFVEAILDHNPELLGNLEDSRQKWSSLHLASARGQLRIVEALVSVDPERCFDSDQDGRNPLHIAAIKGKIEVFEVLVDARPFAAREKTKRGETILHLCVKYHQLEALKKLVEAVDDDEFLNQTDGDGLTILHLAVIGKQIEIINYLLTTRIELNARNAKGQTALNMVPQNPKDRQKEIEKSLRQADALTADEITNQQSNFDQVKWLEQKIKALMVVASLIANMAFQAGINPPGGVWQDDQTEHSQENPSLNNAHDAGQSIMAYHKIQFYRFFISFNTIAFVSSLGTISLLISGLPFRRRVFMRILNGVMWLTATSILLSYGISVAFVTPESTKQRPGNVAVVAWSFVITIYLLGIAAAYSTNTWWKLCGRIKWRSRNSVSAVIENNRNGNLVELQIYSS